MAFSLRQQMTNMWYLSYFLEKIGSDMTIAMKLQSLFHICLCWGFTAQSTQWGHVERGLFTNHTFTGQA